MATAIGVTMPACRSVFVTSILLAVLSGCGGGGSDRPAKDTAEPREPRTAPATARAGFVRVDGRTRRFFLSMPRRRAGTRLPLVLAFHGRWDSAQRMRRATRLDRAAGRLGAAVAYMQGVEEQWSDADRPRADGLDPDADVRFVEATIAKLAARGHVDPDRVYAAGHSNGGGFALRLASERPGLLAGAAAVAGQLATGTGAPQPAADAPPVLIVYGADDPLRPYDGLDVPSDAGPDAPTPSMGAVESAAAFARDARGPSVRRLPDRRDDGTSVTRSVWSSDGRLVAALLTVDGGGHTWPGSALSGDPGTGRVSAELDAAEVVSRFLLRGELPRASR